MAVRIKSLAVLALLAVVHALAADHPLPCILTHGCVCNGSIAFQNPADHQYYGTCTECSTGWTGRTCSIKACQNLGTFNATSRVCDCPLPWTASSCTERVCPHSTGGAGIDHVLPPDNTTAFCNQCEPGFAGLSCDMCTATNACQAYHGEAYVCSTQLTPRGPRKLLECEVTDKRFMGPLGPKRPGVGGRVSFTCDSEGPDVPFGQRPTGTCAVAFFRTEPQNAYIDPFFFCTAANCTASSTIAATDVSTTTKSPSGSIFAAARQLGEVAIFGVCTLLCVLQWPLLDNLRKAVVQRTAVALVVFLAVFVAISAIAMDTRPTAMRESVTYSCQTASCICADNPPNASYQPTCKGSVFDSVIIPMIQHSITVQCFTDTQDCVFTPSDLQTNVKIHCEASECVNATRFPPLSVRDAAAVAGASLPAFEGQATTIALVVGVCIVAIGLAFAYRHAAKKSRRLAIAEFRALFLSNAVLDAGERTTAVAETNGGNHTQVDDERLGLRGNAHTAAAAAGEEMVDGEDDGGNASDRQPLFCLPASSTAPGTFASSLTLSAAAQREIRRDMQRTVALSLHNLSYSLLPPPSFSMRGVAASPPQPILSNVTFTVTSGEMLALMGPSGAGKTTLLDILSARSKPGVVDGAMTLCGDAIAEANGNIAGFRSIVGYVSQEDTLLPALTVRQTVEFAARLKLPCAFSDDTICQVVDTLLASLGLARCQHTLVGDSTRIRGVSGGERRRVSIAVELVANPRILFLDEPTSGLDACSALHVMQTVAALAKTSPLRPFAPHFFSFRPVVVFSIHQPSAEIYGLFHKVLLLSRGVVVYHGIAHGAPAVMAEHLGRLQAHDLPRVSSNPAEALMQLEESIASDAVRCALATATTPTAAAAHPSTADGDAGREGEQDPSINGDVAVDTSGDAAHDDGSASILRHAAAMKKYYPDGWRQWVLLTSRSFYSLVGSYYLVVCHAFVTLVVGGLMNFLYHQEGLDLPGALNRAGSLTFLLLVIAFVSLSALDQLLSERKLCIVERENGFYTTLPYLLAKVVVDIVPLRIVPVVMLAGVIYGPMGLRTDNGSHWLWFLCILVLFSVCITLVVMCIGIVTSNFGSSALLSSVLILWTFVFGGLLAQAETMPVALRPMRLLSPFFLAFESLIVNELDGLMCTFAPTDATGKPSTDQIPLMCVQYVFNMGLHPNNFGRDVVLLAVQCVVLTWLCWVLLAKVTSVQR